MRGEAGENGQSREPVRPSVALWDACLLTFLMFAVPTGVATDCVPGRSVLSGTWLVPFAVIMTLQVKQFSLEGWPIVHLAFCWLACHCHGGTCAEQGLWDEHVCLLRRLDVQSGKQQLGLGIAAAISWHIDCAAGADG